MKNFFRKISTTIASLAGSTRAFVLAIIVVLVWAVTGPYYHFSDTWLTAIAAITNVIIFIMVFSIQSTQNRDSKAIHLKLNELINSNKKARDAFIGLEELTDQELEEIDNEFKEILTKVEPNHPLHKLHKKIAEEKSSRFKLSKQAERFVGALLSPFTDENKD